MELTSLFFWDLQSFFFFVLNLIITLAIMILATEIRPWKENVFLDILFMFIPIIVVVYYTLVVAENIQIATDLDKAIVLVLWVTIFSLLLYRIVKENFLSKSV